MRGWVGSRADMDVNVEKKNLLSPRAGQGHVSAQGRSLIQRPPLIVCRHFKPINFFGWGQGWNSFWQRVSKLLIIFGEILSRVETWVYEHCISDRYSDISVPLSPGLLASAGIWSLERSASSEKPYPLPYCSSNVHSRWYFCSKLSVDSRAHSLLLTCQSVSGYSSRLSSCFGIFPSPIAPFCSFLSNSPLCVGGGGVTSLS